MSKEAKLLNVIAADTEVVAALLYALAAKCKIGNVPGAILYAQLVAEKTADILAALEEREGPA